MEVSKTGRILVRAALVGGLSSIFAAGLAGDALAEGSRYDLPRDYHSEISSGRAYLNMMDDSAVLIDVRRLREYGAGHPEKAYNVPYPHVVGRNDQDPQVLYDEILDIVGGDLDTPVMTLCRTGYRSVLAANILANPEAHGVVGAPFTNVRNIWEGFVGRYLEANVGETDADDLVAVGRTGLVGAGQTGVVDSLFDHEDLHHNYLDLNNNGEMDGDVADVCTHSTDANPDKDGWRNHQDLPRSSEIDANLAYLGDPGLYPECIAP